VKQKPKVNIVLETLCGCTRTLENVERFTGTYYQVLLPTAAKFFDPDQTDLFDVSPEVNRRTFQIEQTTWITDDYCVMHYKEIRR
jgi:hypothetical protein